MTCVLPVDEHLDRCLAAVETLQPRELVLLDALDRVLAQDVTSGVDLPGFANSSMDGYAVHVADVAGAGDATPVTLPVLADVAAGPAQRITLPPGHAVRIMTGAPVPEGAGAIVPVEWTDGGDRAVAVRRAPDDGAYVRAAGEDVRAGELVVRRGTRLSPRHLALLAAVGRDRVLVHPRPRVAVLSTGSELVPPGGTLAFGQIFDANGYGLTAAAAELGADARHAGFVGDDEDAVLATLQAEVDAGADLLITSGGVSAGVYDVVKAVLRRVGTVRFDKVAMQPGMPQGFGTVTASSGTVPIFTLPGNPVSSMVSFELFVRPVIRRLAGEQTLHRPCVEATAAVDWSSPAGKRQFVRAVLEGPQDGPLTVRPVGGQGSHLVADLAEATCLAVVPEDVTAVAAGDVLQCLLLERGR